LLVNFWITVGADICGVALAVATTVAAAVVVVVAVAGALVSLALTVEVVAAGLSVGAAKVAVASSGVFVASTAGEVAEGEATVDVVWLSGVAGIEVGVDAVGCGPQPVHRASRHATATIRDSICLIAPASSALADRLDLIQFWTE
jgi:hypothetical protein